MLHKACVLIKTDYIIFERQLHFLSKYKRWLVEYEEYL